jgi:hypothetical protein
MTKFLNNIKVFSPNIKSADFRSLCVNLSNINIANITENMYITLSCGLMRKIPIRPKL